MTYEHTPPWVAAVEDGNRLSQSMRPKPQSARLTECRKRGELWAAIRQLLQSEHGLTSERLASVAGLSARESSRRISEFLSHSMEVIYEARWPGAGPRKHWFSTQAQADAYMASDPSARVLAKAETIRLTVGKRAIEIPRHAARRVARELLEAMEC